MLLLSSFFARVPQFALKHTLACGLPFSASVSKPPLFASSSTGLQHRLFLCRMLSPCRITEHISSFCLETSSRHKFRATSDDFTFTVRHMTVCGSMFMGWQWSFSRMRFDWSSLALSSRLTIANRQSPTDSGVSSQVHSIQKGFPCTGVFRRSLSRQPSSYPSGLSGA
jgi:hypothetical protein